MQINLFHHTRIMGSDYQGRVALENSGNNTMTEISKVKKNTS
jgi:hypothetical protein